jgi:hypothetical protein
MAESSLQDEDRACDFLHVGSGSKTLATFLVPPRSVGIDSSKLAVRNSQCRGLNRTMPYSGRSMRESNPQPPLRPGEKSSESIARERNNISVENCKQSDFENLSLGPGCPWLDSADLHI